MATTTSTASSSTAPAPAPTADVKPNATIATKIGLTVPIKEKAIKAYVASLAGGQKELPRQVPKGSIVTVSAAVENLLTTLLAASVANTEGTTFNVDNLVSTIRGSDNLAILVPFLVKGLDHVQANKDLKKSKKKGGDEAASADAEDDGANGKAPFSFSCLNQIGKQIKSHNDALRVSSDATDMVQFLIDEIYQHVVAGGFAIAKGNGRKTISRSDVLISLQIFVPEQLATSMLAHVEVITAKYKLVEDAKVKATPAAKTTSKSRSISPNPASTSAPAAAAPAAKKVVKKTIAKPVK